MKQKSKRVEAAAANARASRRAKTANKKRRKAMADLFGSAPDFPLSEGASEWMNAPMGPIPTRQSDRSMISPAERRKYEKALDGVLGLFPASRATQILVDYFVKRTLQGNRRIAATLAKDAQAKRGFLHLISQEGGVVSEREAAVLHGDQTLATDEAVREAARLGQLIAVKDAHGNMRFPVWQFSEKGGALPGLRETMGVLRQHPHYHDLLPFTFFLNLSARLGGKRPLDLLRRSKDSDLRLVFILAAEAAE